MTRARIFGYLVLGVCVIAISVYGFTRLRQRPWIPRYIPQSTIQRLDHIDILTEKDVEFVLSQRAIGDWVQIQYERDGVVERSDVQLVAYYSQAPFLFIYLVIGLTCFTIGIVVIFLRPNDLMAQIFFFAVVAFSSITIINQGFYSPKESWVSILPGVLYFLLYPLAPALLLHFSLKLTRKGCKMSVLIIYMPAFLFATILIFLFLYSLLNVAIDFYRYYQTVYYLFRFYTVIYVIGAVVLLVSGSRRGAMAEERAQIKWIFFGLFIGLGPFILLYQLPQLFKSTPLISDELSNVFFIFVPLAFAFAIIRFKLMDIELILNRSLVYSILTIFTVSVYLFLVRFMHELVSRVINIQEAVVTALAALAAAAAFHPARSKIQRFVDKSFFRLAYDYRKSIRSFNERAHMMADKDHLVEFFSTKLMKMLPLDSLGILVYSVKDDKKILIVKEESGKKIEGLPTEVFEHSQISAKSGSVRMEEGIDFSNELILADAGLEMVISLPFRFMTLEGFLLLGKKKSGERYSRDDLDLLLSMADGLAVNLERIVLLEEVFLERAEKHKLDELNRMKTEFIATVSHELRTPLSSIHSLSEMLQDGKVKNKAKEGELLGVMADESSRLARFVHNVLDIGKIEQNLKTYSITLEEIQPILEESIALFHGILEREGIVLHKIFPKKAIVLKIDKDAIKQALTNILDNAIKYSREEGEITVRIKESNGKVEIQIQDKGIGISSEDRKKIFDDFFRS
ncbi:MAG: histidine kinase dimerization/phospho-acceptor domain-containing protein, partial [Candidatus Aminicenantes bacterium]